MLNDIISVLFPNLNTKEISYIYLIISTLIIIIIFYILKKINEFILKKRLEGKKLYVVNQGLKVILNIFEVIIIILVWTEYIKSLMTLISVISAAMTIALREIILNFFSGIYIRAAKPFKVEDRIELNGIKGDVMSISLLNFEILEVDNNIKNGQSTGVIVTFPNSYVFTYSLKNINKGFKYIWDEITINLNIDCNLKENKQELYKIVNSIEIIKNIPEKMENQIKDITKDKRIYFNHYEPAIYTKIVDDHIELTIRYLMHPKKARYVNSKIYNKIIEEYKEGKIDLYIKK